MSDQIPDWHRRMRELERRCDNRTTDIARLWQAAPQVPEWPGYAMPVIIPSSTAPPSTTTTTTTSTTSTSTTTTSTTTTPPPLACLGDYPATVTLVASGFSGGSCALTGFNGTWSIHQYFCHSSADGPNVEYRIGVPGGAWSVRVYGRYVASGFSASYLTFDVRTIFAGIENEVWYGRVYTPFPVSPELSGVQSFLLGQTFSIPLIASIASCAEPSSITLKFSSTLGP